VLHQDRRNAGGIQSRQLLKAGGTSAALDHSDKFVDRGFSFGPSAVYVVALFWSRKPRLKGR
jgi:hypothetical protein